MRRALERACPGLRLQVAEDGEKAIEALAAGAARPTHVILDLKLPNLTGLEVLRWIRERSDLAGLPVVALTSSGEKRDVESVHRLGVDAYHTKPVSLSQLDALVQSLLSEWNIR